MRRLGTVAVLVVLVSALTGCGDTTFAVIGTLTIASNSNIQGGDNNPGADCQGQSDLADVVEGAQVVVKDPSGKEVGVGSLGVGRLRTGFAQYQEPVCTFTFEVSGVPEDGSGIYSVTIGQRQPYTFKQSEARHLSLSVSD